MHTKKSLKIKQTISDVERFIKNFMIITPGNDSTAMQGNDSTAMLSGSAAVTPGNNSNSMSILWN